MISERLKKDRENLVQQQQKALAVYHQATGAIAYIDSLADIVEEDEEDTVEEANDGG